MKIKWKREDCFLCKGTGKVFANGVSRRMVKCYHTYHLATFNNFIASAEREVKEAQKELDILLKYEETGIVGE